MSIGLLFDLHHSIKEGSKLFYDSHTRKKELEMLKETKDRIYNSLIEIASAEHPDKYLSGHLFVLSLLNILCGRDFIDKKVIHLLTFAMECSEEDFKEIILMFIK